MIQIKEIDNEITYFTHNQPILSRNNNLTICFYMETILDLGLTLCIDVCCCHNCSCDVGLLFTSINREKIDFDQWKLLVNRREMEKEFIFLCRFVWQLATYVHVYDFDWCLDTELFKHLSCHIVIGKCDQNPLSLYC